MVLKDFIIPPMETLCPNKTKNGIYSFPICYDIFRRLKIDYNRNGEGLETDLIPEIEEQVCKRAELKKISELSDCDGNFSLFPHQRVGVKWLIEAKKGILADEQGMGKTVTALVAAKKLNSHKVIVCCSKTKKAEWMKHIIIWTNSKVQILSGTVQEKIEIIKNWNDGYLITSYQSLEKYVPLTFFDTLICDEAHIIRNKKTNFFSSVKQLSSWVKYVFLITASPTVNKAYDIWTLLSVVDSQRFTSFWSFVFRFFEVKYTRYGIKIGEPLFDERIYLKDLLEGYVLSRPQLTNMPHVNKKLTNIPFHKNQLFLYEQIKNLKPPVDFSDLKIPNSVSKYQKLRDITLHPKILFKDYNLEDNEKFKYIKEKIQRFPKRRIIIFISSVRTQLLLKEYLKDYNVEIMNYKTSEIRRDELVQMFLKDKFKILISTFKTGGEGLNLGFCDYSIFYDLAWHPAGNKHAQDRIVRLDSWHKEVYIEILHIPNSIEDHILNLISQKKKVNIKELIKLDERQKNGSKNSNLELFSN